jgi:transaldolase
VDCNMTLLFSFGQVTAVVSASFASCSTLCHKAEISLMTCGCVLVAAWKP